MCELLKALQTMVVPESTIDARSQGRIKTCFKISMKSFWFIEKFVIFHLIKFSLEI